MGKLGPNCYGIWEDDRASEVFGMFFKDKEGVFIRDRMSNVLVYAAAQALLMELGYPKDTAAWYLRETISYHDDPLTYLAGSNPEVN